MTIQFTRDLPIYSQLVNRICSEIVRNERLPGNKLPSVREYALEVGVNVNTVQRVYKELEQMALTETKRGQGTFITTDDSVLLALREKIKQQITEEFVRKIEEHGFSHDEILFELQKYRGELDD
ncbi:GntR family transcriptional regulator [Kurthia sibirica]|uniref:GntR family transcriptional regulator n=1 Tax=Kurthia sibirica TaxID=202750 RepID=A0A2U3ANH4_9BACL|nr:GntR family transcriptional regulator [Kurthia sibirica]PWI26071.1 GntR family transcriptional regulator [Kurthia sibirica]GEK34778.1 putative HTH-type transcriptional regulator YhcF [Kurthia sibirica]